MYVKSDPKPKLLPTPVKKRQLHLLAASYYTTRGAHTAGRAFSQLDRRFDFGHPLDSLEKSAIHHKISKGKVFSRDFKRCITAENAFRRH